MLVNSPLNYTGNKFNLLPHILPHFPKDIESFWDVFCGGGSVFSNVDYNKIYVNDIIPPLVNLYKELKSSSWESIEYNIRKYVVDKNDRQGYLDLRDEFNKPENCNNPYMFFVLVQSCTNNMMRFSGDGITKPYKFNQTHGVRMVSDKTWDKLKSFYNKIQPLDITFLNMDYYKTLDIIKETKGSFVYLDSPYGTKDFTESGYSCYWKKTHEDALWDYIDELNDNNIRFLMSNVSYSKGVQHPNYNRMTKYNVVDINYDYQKVARIKEQGRTQEVIIKNF
jgi:DNA adenine methylase Dam